MQREVVQDLSEGFTAEQVASRRNRSIGTVRKHIEHAKERLNARNAAHLVKLALLQGLIHSVVFALVMASVFEFDPNYRRGFRYRYSVAGRRIVEDEV